MSVFFTLVCHLGIKECGAAIKMLVKQCPKGFGTIIAICLGRRTFSESFYTQGRGGITYTVAWRESLNEG
jgi:hypothetical protein